MSDGIAARVAAARTLDEVLHRGRSLKAALGSALPQLDDVRDRALVEAIVLTALRQRVRALFEPHVGPGGAHFKRPMHVRLLRKPGT